MSPQRAMLLNVLVGAAALLIAVAAVDSIAFFVLGLRTAGHGTESLFQFSPVLGHFHRPLAESYCCPYNGSAKYYVRINSYGFADAEWGVEKARPRIALVGDSTTECWEAGESHRIDSLLERSIGDRFEVLNLGVRAYGTDQTCVLLKTVGLAFDPDIIVYTFCVNDVSDNANTQGKPYFEIDEGDTSNVVLCGYPVRYEPTGPRGVLSDVWRYSFVYRTCRRGFTALGRRASNKPARGSPMRALRDHPSLRPYKVSYNDEDRRRWLVTRRLMGLMQDLAVAEGARFLVVEGVYRPVVDEAERSELVRRYGDQFDFDKVTRLLETFTSERGIAFVSLPRAARAQGLEASDLMHPSDTLHLDDRGTELWCSAVAHKLQSLGWLDG